MVEDPDGALIKQTDADYFIAATLCAVRLRKAQAYLFHLENCEEDPDENAISSASHEVHEAKHMLDTALALVGDEFAAQRLNLKKGDQQDAA